MVKPTFVEEMHASVQRAAAFALSAGREARTIATTERKIDEHLRRELLALEPSATWFSEESKNVDRVPITGLTWVVDAIDGTKDYARGRPGWAVSACLLADGQPLVGSLIAPERSECWHAVSGDGARLNGRPIACSFQKSLEGARIAANCIWKRDSNMVCIGRPYSIALRIAMVASGGADIATSYSDIHVWDIAAAVLIAQEAGTIVSTATNGPVIFTGDNGEVPSLVAANPWLHREMLDRISNCGVRKETFDGS